MSIAKIPIVCRSCGKAFEARSTQRNSAAARSWEAWAREHMDTCPECYAREKREKELEAVKAKALEWMGDHFLPELTGTPRQIAWAEDLRYSRIAEIAERYRPDQAADWFWRWIEGADSAQKWIECRDMITREFLKMVKEAKNETQRGPQVSGNYTG